MEIIETKIPSEEAGKALGNALSRHADTPILLMLSGGSALTMLDFVSKEALGPHVTVTMLDERYSKDSGVNNFAQLEQTNFYKTGIERGVHSIPTKVLGDESMEKLRDRFANALHEWKRQYKNGVVIATIGIGLDGHVAGIFPGEHSVDFNDNHWVVGYSVPSTVNQYPDRVTVTNTFLCNQIQEVIAFVTGSEKREIIKELYDNIHHNKIMSAKPMGVIFKMKKASLYTNITLKDLK